MSQNPKEKAKQPHKTRTKTKSFEIMNVNNSNSFSVTMNKILLKKLPRPRTPASNVLVVFSKRYAYFIQKNIYMDKLVLCSLSKQRHSLLMNSSRFVLTQ